MTDQKRVWLITGVSSGFGLELAKMVLARGEIVVGTLRKEEQLAGFRALAPGRAHALQLDVTDQDAIPGVVERAASEAGTIDVLANNAGYGLLGAVEEVSDAEARHVMETNFFGQLNMIKAVLPLMRAKRSGHILNFSSVAGYMGIPGYGLYCAAKFAVGGLSETLAVELQPFNIKVTVVQPGGFRTNFAGSSKVEASQVIEDYTDTPAAMTKAAMSQYCGHEPGDPIKAAAALIQLVDAPNPPVHLILGADSLNWARGKLDELAKDYDVWEAVSCATDVDGG